MKLTERQQRFCTEYMIDGNATQAAIRAGYSKLGAGTHAGKLMKNAQILSEITLLRKDISKCSYITRDRVLQEYARIAFLDPRKLFDKKGDLIPLHKLDADTAAAISAIDIESVTNLGFGQGKVNKTLTKFSKFKLSDKKAALDSICKVLAFNAPEKAEPNIQAVINMIGVGDGKQLSKNENDIDN